MKIEKTIRFTIGQVSRSAHMMAELADSATAQQIDATLRGMESSEGMESSDLLLSLPKADLLQN